MAIVSEICGVAVPDDGLTFDPETIDAWRIKEDAEYAGVRVTFRGRLGNARVHMQVDVGFGDAPHPGTVDAQYPALLDLPAATLRTYPPETVVAEKAQAMVHLGTLNSRMKDFYDVWRLSRQRTFDGEDLRQAVSKTFGNRNTELVSFDDLVTELLEDESFPRQWTAFLRKTLVDGPASFSDVADSIGVFLSPVFTAAKNGRVLQIKWNAPGPWAAN